MILAMACEQAANEIRLAAAAAEIAGLETGEKGADERTAKLTWILRFAAHVIQFNPQRRGCSLENTLPMGHCLVLIDIKP